MVEKANVQLLFRLSVSVNDMSKVPKTIYWQDLFTGATLEFSLHVLKFHAFCNLAIRISD